MHNVNETGRFGAVRRDQQEVVDEAEQQAVLRVEKGKHADLEVGVEVIAEDGRQNGALRYASLLPVELLADFDEIVLDVGGHELQQIRRVISPLEGVFYVDCVSLVAGRTRL